VAGVEFFEEKRKEGFLMQQLSRAEINRRRHVQWYVRNHPESALAKQVASKRVDKTGFKPALGKRPTTQPTATM